MINSPEVAVIIPHYNDLVRLERCLEALVPQAGPEAEIVVVDNGSTEALESVITKFPGVRFVTEAEKGAAPARNRGVAETTAPGLAFLDADCVPEAGWLARARGCAGTGRVVGGRIDVFDETEPPRTGAEAFEAVFAFRQKDYVERDGFSVTANLVTTRAVFEDTGPFRAGLSEDLDWCRRATAKGYAISYEDALAVRHPARADWAALKKKWRRLTAEGFALDGQGARLRWGIRALAMPASALVHVPRVLAHKGLGDEERARALIVLVRLRLARMVWMLKQAVTGRP